MIDKPLLLLAAKCRTLVEQFPGEYTPLKSSYNAIMHGVYSAGPISRRLTKATAFPRASIINDDVTPNHEINKYQIVREAAPIAAQSGRLIFLWKERERE